MMDGPRQIFTKYHKDVLAICYHYTWNLEEAEEITQEVFVKLLANFSSFDEEVNLKAWLYRVAINRCLDIKRRIATRAKHFGMLFQMAAEKTGTNDLKAVEVRNELEKILTKVEAKTRMVLILKFMEEMEYSQISELMNIPEGTLKARVSRVLKGMRK